MTKKFLIYMLITLSIIIISFTIFLYIKAPIFFKPKNKTIQYQEEVKLSDGSMIWVDIKRHYWLSGGALGDAGMFTGSYMPGIVEISWDTGFEGVGRQSVFFDNHLYLIDKIADEWYVVGYRYPYEGSRDGIDSTNCRDIGSLMGNNHYCVASISKNFGFVKKNQNEVNLINSLKYNIAFSVGYADFEKNIQPYIKNNYLGWQDKLQLKDRISVTEPFNLPQE